MWTPSRPSRPSEWFSSGLAVLALLVFAGGGAWGHQQWEEQKTRDDLRTSQLIGCLEAAHRAADTIAATNVCLHDYADRVPALRRQNPDAFVVPRTTASATPVLDAMNAVVPPVGAPLSLAHATEIENGPDLGVGEDGSVQRSEVSGSAAAQPADPLADHGKPHDLRGAPTSDSIDPPKVPASTSVSPSRPDTTPTENACNRHDRDRGLCEDSSAGPSPPQ